MASRLLLLLVLVLASLEQLHAQSLNPYAYDIGSPVVTDYYVDSVSGSDSADGTTQGSAWRTLQHAWSQIPASATLAHGYRINLMNGSYGEEELPNYWENRRGTFSHPIIIRASPGQTAVRFTRDINMANTSYFYLLGVNIAPVGGGDAFHCEACDHLLIRGCTLNGGSTSGGAHETIKVNQSQYVYLENNEILYADDNAIDFVGVQFGHIIGNRVHEAVDWCIYVKGGSAQIRIEANQIFNCGTGGFTAGQGSGFQFMASPWLHYEAYDIKFINNLVYNTEGAAFGVNGGYNVLLAHNTAYNVGSRSHLVEVVFGERTCDGESDGQANSVCAAYHNQGGWGPSTVQTVPEPIGNKNVYILNNVLLNPAGTVAPQHFAVYGPRSASPGLNIDSPQRTDANLVIQGNMLWNGVGSALLGVEEADQGCQPANSTCNVTQLQNQNSINAVEPALLDPVNLDFRPVDGGSVLLSSAAGLASFPGGDRPAAPEPPQGILENSFIRDFSGAEAAGSRIIGAFNASDVALSPPAIDGYELPANPESMIAPSILRAKARSRRAGRKFSVTVIARIDPAGEPDVVTATLRQRNRSLGVITLESNGSSYRGSKKVAGRAGKKIKIRVSATNAAGAGIKNASVVL